MRRGIRLVWVNPCSVRIATRAALRVVSAGGIDWAKLKRDAEAFRKRTQRYVEANRNVG